ncbi:phage repressor protein CI [Citrobacter amalonaticus]|uniref:phage repressor protein CI n=1 Tax=Citrobacter amalonaticus TaxID=35703 RepID=UPI00374A39BD
MDLSNGGKGAIERMVEAYGFSTRQALCEQLGVSKSSLATRYMRDSFPADWVIQCALETKVSLEWLVTGSGPKFNHAHSDLLHIPRKKLIEGVLCDAGSVMFDKLLLPNEISSPVLIQDGTDSLYVDTKQVEVLDGEWLISIDGKVSVKNLIRLPENKVKIDYGKITVDVQISTITILGKIFAKFLLKD